MLILLGQLRRVYVDIIQKDRTEPDTSYEDDNHPCTAILNSLEKRWHKADQDLFVACVFLNPNFKASLFNPQKITLAILIGILQRLYMHIFHTQECPRGFIEEIMHYVEGTGIYCDDMWCVDELSAYLKDAVSYTPISVFSYC